MNREIKEADMESFQNVEEYQYTHVIMLLHHDSKKNSTGTSLIYGSGALPKSYDAYLQFLSLLKQAIHHWIYSQLSVAPHVLTKR